MTGSPSAVSMAFQGLDDGFTGRHAERTTHEGKFMEIATICDAVQIATPCNDRIFHVRLGPAMFLELSA